MAVTVRLEEVPCPLCDSPEREPHLAAPDHTGVVAGEFTVVRCLSCGMGYLSPRPVPEDLPLCYGEEYGPHRDPEGGRRRKLSWSDRLVLRHVYGWPFRGPPPGARHPGSRAGRLLAGLWSQRFQAGKKNLRLVPFEGRGRLLDLGCGSGGTLALYAEGGWDAKGIEIDPVAAERARTHHRLEVVTGTVHDAPWAAESFDVVQMSHVLEHVLDPNEVLERVRELLVPDGLLVLSVPVLDGHAVTKLGPWWHYLELPRHLLHYPRRRLLEYLEGKGFGVERVRDDPAGDGWRWSMKTAPEELRRERWFIRLACSKRHRHRVSARLAREGRSSFVVVHARRSEA